MRFRGCMEVYYAESVVYFERILYFGVHWSVFCCRRPFSNRNKHKSSKSCHHNTFSAKCVKRSQLDSISVDSIQLDSIEYLGVYYSVFRLNDVLSVFGCAMSSISCVFGVFLMNSRCVFFCMECIVFV